MAAQDAPPPCLVCGEPGVVVFLHGSLEGTFEDLDRDYYCEAHSPLPVGRWTFGSPVSLGMVPTTRRVS